MSPLPVIAAAMKTALGVLQGATGQTLYYRVNGADTWHSFVGFLQQSAPVQIGQDENHGAIMAPENARLKVPTDGVHLVPGANGVRGAEVKDHNGVVWAVLGVDHANGQSIYALGRAPVQSIGARTEP